MSITAPRRGSIRQGLKPCTVSMVGSHTGAPAGTFVPDTLLELDPESPPDTLLELTPENLLELTGEPAGTHRILYRKHHRKLSSLSHSQAHTILFSSNQ